MPLTDAEIVKVFEAASSTQPEREIVKSLSESPKRDPKTLRRYLKALHAIRQYGITGLMDDRQWEQVNDSLGQHGIQKGGITRHFVEDLARAYCAWQQRQRDREPLNERDPVSVHVQAILAAAGRLAQQVLSVPTPIEVIHETRKPSATWAPGCLDPDLLPPGRVDNEPAFLWLYEHTKTHPIWATIPTWETEWWGYLNRIANTINLIREVSESETEGSLPNDFATTILEYAFEPHLGLSPSIGGQDRITYYFDGMNPPVHSLKWCGVTVAQGTEDQVNRAANAHRSLLERFASAPDLVEIVEQFRGLLEKAKAFDQFVKELTPKTLLRGSCPVCTGDTRKYLYSELLKERQAGQLAKEAQEPEAGAPVETLEGGHHDTAPRRQES